MASSGARRPATTIGIIACGALAQHVHRISDRQHWPVRVYPLNAALHNHPGQIAGRVAELAESARRQHDVVLVAYADCGTYGALAQVCEALDLPQLSGSHCYDVFAGAGRLADEFATEPATYLLTDFLVRSFDRTVWRGLGLDRYPELRDDYFGNYRQVLWLAQHRTPALQAAAERIADALRLRLEIRDVGDLGLEAELRALLVSAGYLVTDA